jgi:SOS-response transcriptional repressor LexA
MKKEKLSDKWDELGEKAWHEILEAVNRLRAEGISLDAIAKKAGAGNRSTVAGWIKKKGSKDVTFPLMLRYLENLGCDLADFFPVPTMRRMGSNAPIEAVKGDNLVPVPIQEHVGAGDEIDFFNAEPERFINILPRFYRKDLRAYVVDGDSMEPIIKKGSIVGVVPVDGPLAEGHIYLVCRPPFGLAIKEVLQKDGQIVLRSANPKYPDDPVPYDGYDDIILGKVIWVWQEC